MTTLGYKAFVYGGQWKEIICSFYRKYNLTGYKVDHKIRQVYFAPRLYDTIPRLSNRVQTMCALIIFLTCQVNTL